MRLRCCVLVCAACGLAAAEPTPDYFSQAFRNAVPSPFPDLKSHSFDLKIDPNQLFSQEPKTLQIFPRQVLVTTSEACAIPLLEAPIPKDRKFSMRKLPVGPAAEKDPMSRASIPACKP